MSLVAVAIVVTLTSCSGAEDMDTSEALEGLEALLSEDVLGDELTGTLRSCPFVDADELFSQFADVIADDDARRLLRDGLLDVLLVSMPSQEVAVATCAVSSPVPNSPLEFARIEIRPATVSPDTFFARFMDPSTVVHSEGGTHRGGSFYEYCATRPDGIRKVCGTGWRNGDLDVSITFNGVEADLVDQTDIEQLLAEHLDDLITGLERLATTDISAI